jgi:thermostable 8-oxoguanine DNA glycosylase
VNEKIKEIFRVAETHPNKDAYLKNLDEITPQTPEDIFWRFVFAFMSIHSTYKSNLRGFILLRNPGAWKSYEALRSTLEASGCGMQNQRARFIWKFREEFFGGAFDAIFDQNSLQEKRNMLCDRLLGIGMAKISFALEMSFPRQNQVVCMDVHQLRLYGKSDTTCRKKTAYMECEDDWTQRSRKIGIPSFVVRNMFWDRLKKQNSLRFWSFVFEPHGDQFDINHADGLSFGDPLKAPTHV